jgi:hypothetical protein
MDRHRTPDNFFSTIKKVAALLLPLVFVSQDTTTTTHTPGSNPRTSDSGETNTPQQNSNFVPVDTFSIEQLRVLPRGEIASILDNGFADNGAGITLDLANAVALLNAINPPATETIEAASSGIVESTETPHIERESLPPRSFESLPQIAHDMRIVIDSLHLNISEYKEKLQSKRTIFNSLLGIQVPLAEAILNKISIAEPVFLSALDSIPNLQAKYDSCLTILTKRQYYNPADPKSLITLALAHSYLEIHRQGKGDEMDSFGGKIDLFLSIKKKDITIFQTLKHSTEVFARDSKKNTRDRNDLALELGNFIKPTGISIDSLSILESYQFIKAFQYAHGFISMMSNYKDQIVISDKDASSPEGEFIKGVISVNAGRLLPTLKSLFDKYFSYDE